MIVLVYIVLMLVASIIIIFAITISDEYSSIISIVLLIIVVIESSFIMAYIINTPTALDVYKGKTELKITYEGKTPVDSVVIYKKGNE